MSPITRLYKHPSWPGICQTSLSHPTRRKQHQDPRVQRNQIDSSGCYLNHVQNRFLTFSGHRPATRPRMPCLALLRRQYQCPLYLRAIHRHLTETLWLVIVPHLRHHNDKPHHPLYLVHLKGPVERTPNPAHFSGKFLMETPTRWI